MPSLLGHHDVFKFGWEFGIYASFHFKIPSSESEARKKEMHCISKHLLGAFAFS